MKRLSASYGGRAEAVIPEWGAPKGDISQQTEAALMIQAVLPTLRAEAEAAFWFASPWAWEPPLFLGKGDVFTVDYRSTAVGHALGLGCQDLQAVAARWPGASIVEVMRAEKCQAAR